MVRFLGLLFLMCSLPVLALGVEDPKDPKDWTPHKIPEKTKAPEFEDISEWINSEPLTMKELKGKVVVVHFMAFG